MPSLFRYDVENAADDDLAVGVHCFVRSPEGVFNSGDLTVESLDEIENPYTLMENEELVSNILAISTSSQEKMTFDVRALFFVCLFN